MMKAVLSSLLVVGLLAGCGSGGNDSSFTVNATGTWQGTVTSSVTGSLASTLSLTQSNSAVTGNYATVKGAVGTVSGTISGSTISFTLTPTQQGCTGSLSGTAKIDAPAASTPTMAFTYSGTTSCGGAETGTGTLTKQ